MEAPVWALVPRREVHPCRAAIVGTLGSCLTHPLLWFVWPRVVGSDYTVYLVTGELGVATLEALLFFALARPVGFWRAVSASFFANAASYLLAVVLL